MRTPAWCQRRPPGRLTVEHPPRRKSRTNSGRLVRGRLVRGRLVRTKSIERGAETQWYVSRFRKMSAGLPRTKSCALKGGAFPGLGAAQDESRIERRGRTGISMGLAFDRFGQMSHPVFVSLGYLVHRVGGERVCAPNDAEPPSWAGRATSSLVINRWIGACRHGATNS